jgi:hypothetical protein
MVFPASPISAERTITTFGIRILLLKLPGTFPSDPFIGVGSVPQDELFAFMLRNSSLLPLGIQRRQKHLYHH